jgi:hypothetical protein
MLRQLAADSITGAVAQLGERWLCKPEVVGSIPISSTKNVTEPWRDVKAVLSSPLARREDPSE